MVILGGEHGDLPLESGAGEAVAKFLVEERVSAVVDLSAFRKHEVATFMAHFLETLYRLKAREQYRVPMMLVIDEADAIAPQRPQKGEERMLGAAEDIVRRGGQRGIGCALVSQRAAVLNKNVLTQIQILITLRTIAPQDLAAVTDWIDVHGTVEEKRQLLASLPSLPVGTAWVWSPGWPTDAGIFRRVEVDPIETFDSSATPKPGEARSAPKTLAEVDLVALRGRLADTIEKAKADDPRELRRQLAEMRQKLTSIEATNRMLVKAAEERKAEAPEPRIVEKVVEIPALTQGEERQLRELAAELGAGLRLIERLFERLQPVKGVADSPTLAPVAQATPARPPKAAEAPVPRSADSGTSPRPTGPERKVLTVLAQHPEGATKRKIALRSGYAVGGGGFGNILSSLRTKGWASGRSEMVITEAGKAALGAWEPLPTGPALVEHWIGELPKAEGLILRVLVDAYPASLAKQEVAERTGYEASGGGFGNALSRLRTLELIEGRGEMRATDEIGGAK
jgi:hypothetical protein